MSAVFAFAGEYAAFGFVVRFVWDYWMKNGRCGEIPPCRKYDVLQFRFIYQSVANRFCVIVSAASDLRKAVLFIQLFCRLVITADFKKNSFYAVTTMAAMITSMINLLK